MSSTVTYKGNTLTTVNNQTRVLNTKGTWLEDDITIVDVTSSGVSGSAISVVDTTDSKGGTVRTITSVDISDTTAVASDVAQGKYFYTANGTKTAGTATSSSPSVLTTKTITTNGTYNASSDNADGYSSVTVNVSGGGGSGTPATQHVVHLEFTDETNTNVNVYYDDSSFSSIITSSKPTTYGQKTVESAQLDGVQWYIRETWETIYDDTPSANDDTPYAYFWLSSLADVYPTAGSVWRITFDGVEYRCVATAVSGDVRVGNTTYDASTWTGDIPFSFYNAGWGAWIGDTNAGAGPHTIKIERLVS